MKTIVCNTYAEMSQRAAEQFAKVIVSKPNCVLGLATGSTPEGLYQNLTKMNQEGKISFSKVHSVNLDEYYPIEPTNTQSYRYFMNEKLFDHVDIDVKNTFVPDGTAKDSKAEGERYEKLIDSLGGIDIQILGIGQNGHIGFNEPAGALEPFTHLTDLTKSTIVANSRFFASENEVPKQALTMGLGSIFKAKEIVVMASGKEKKTAVQALLAGKLDTNIPVTLLNLHTNVTLICTKDCYN